MYVPLCQLENQNAKQSQILAIDIVIHIGPYLRELLKYRRYLTTKSTKRPKLF